MASIQSLKKAIIEMGHLLWQKELISGLNGNISMRVDRDHILLTATKTCKGLLQQKDILFCDLEGHVKGRGVLSTEKILHTQIYKNFPDIQGVIHTHTPYINGYFLERDTFEPRIFEARLYLGVVEAIKQTTPNVHDIAPVIEQLRNRSVVVLRNHGVLAMGPTLMDAFFHIQNLEEAVKTECIALNFHGTQRLTRDSVGQQEQCAEFGTQKKYDLFSREQMEAIVKIVNADLKLKQLGEQTRMTMEFAVKLDESGEIYSFQFENGQIVKMGQNEQAEFLSSASAQVWRSVFNREIDPFVATTQKKMQLRGDFSRLSKWYAPCSRLFELWAHIPVK